MPHVIINSDIIIKNTKVKSKMDNTPQNNPSSNTGQIGDMNQTPVTDVRTSPSPNAPMNPPIANTNTSNTEPNSKWPWIVVLVIVLILIIGAIGLLIWQPWNDKNGNGNQNTTGQIDGSNNTNVNVPGGLDGSEVGNGDPTDEIDSEAREIYGRFVGDGSQFAGVNTPAESLWTFRSNPGMMSGQLDRYLMLTLAGYNVGRTSCNGTHVNTDFGGYVVENCYNGSAIREEVERLFGQKLQFTEDDVIGQICKGSRYDAESDEFVEVGDGCGFYAPEWYASAIVGSERSGDKMYTYEKVLLVSNADGGGVGLYHVDDNQLSERIDAVDIPYENDYDDYQRRLNAELTKYAAQNGDEFKWTFRKTNSGNYVFEKIEKVSQ